MSWQTVQQWENGKTAPTRLRLPFVAKVLGCEVSDLLESKGPPMRVVTAGVGVADRPSITRTVQRLAEALASVGKPTRMGVMGLLNGLVEQPDQGAQIGGQVEALLNTAVSQAA